jgi:hypothetical protein
MYDLANNLILLLHLQVCCIQDGSIAEGLLLYNAEKERGLLEVCCYNRARRIYADTALPNKRRIWLGLYRQFKEDSYRHSGDDE